MFEIKGIAVETIVYTVLLIIAIVIMTIIFTKIVPFAGKMLESGFSAIKAAICEKIGFFSFLFGC